MDTTIKFLLFVFFGLPLMIVVGVLWYHAIDLLFIYCESVKEKIIKNTEVIKMREKTGYYDRKGKEIRDGDKIKAIVNGQIVYGEVEEFNDDWLMKRSTWSPFLGDLDDVEILEGD